MFAFADGFGADKITDFDATDTLEKLDISKVNAVTFTDYAGFASDHLSTQGNDVLFAAGGDSVLLKNVLMTDLDSTDFLF